MTGCPRCEPRDAINNAGSGVPPDGYHSPTEQAAPESWNYSHLYSKFYLSSPLTRELHDLDKG